MANPKYQQIAEVLRQRIQGGAFQHHLPTEQALCAEFGVSRQTVRQALSLLQSEGLIERRQGSGSFICESAELMPPAGERLSIAVVTTYISDYIFPSILREIEAVLSENNCTPLLFATQNQVATERRILQTLLDMDVLDGILVEGTKTGFPNPNLDLYQELMIRKVPLVFMHGNYPELKDTVAVLDDNAAGGKMLVEYLYKKGHRRIAGVFKSDDIQGHQRYAGYIEAIKELGLSFDDGQVLWYDTELKRRILEGFFNPDICLPILKDCTAVVCYNDEIASHIVTVLVQQGVSVPGQMAVVSFDNSQYSEMTTPRITSLSHEAYNIGRLAAQSLLSLLKGKPCETIRSPWTLIEKESS